MISNVKGNDAGDKADIFYGKKKKKKKKRFRRFWGNCPVMKKYKRRFVIGRDEALDGREKRYLEERFNYQKLLLLSRENVGLMKIKGGSLNCYNVRPDERRQKDLSCESETQTLNQPPAVVASVGAAERNVIINYYNGRQSAGDECTPILMVGTNSLISVTDTKKVAEEVIIVTGSGKYFNIRDIYVITISRSFIKVNSRSQFNLGCKCDAQTIDHSSAVAGSVGAVEAGHLFGKNKCVDKPQSVNALRLENGTICLLSEINPKSIDEFSCISNNLTSFSSHSQEDFSCFNIITWTRNNSNNYHHASSKGCKTKEFCFEHDGNSFYVGMKNVKFDSCSQIDYVICEFRRTKQQELLLNRGRLIYTKNWLFGVNYSNSFQFDEVVSKFTSEAKSPGIKSIPLITT
jgi:hypothetical protein